MDGDAEAAERVDLILDQVRSRGGRVTAVTRRVVEIVAAHPHRHYRRSDFVEHDDIDETVAPSTIYRTVERLVAYGILSRSQLGDGNTSFGLTGESHEHLMCERCGAVIDTSAHLLDGVAEKVRQQYDFVLRIGAVALQGTCGTCRRSEAAV